MANLDYNRRSLDFLKIHCFMKKEMLLTVLVGLIIGLIITFGMYRARLAQIPEESTLLTATATPTTDVEGNQSGTLVLHSPEDEIIVDGETLTIAGTTQPNIYIAIFVNDLESITTADASGNFSVQKELENGSNVIVVQAIAADGTVTKVERTVIYSTVDIELATPEATSSASPTPAL